MKVVFVNKQNIDKRYRVKAYQSSVPTSVLPFTIYLAIDGSSQMQNNEYFKLSNWMFYPVEEKAFKLVRYELVTSHINVIVGEPTLLNLNNFENLTSILQSFRKRAKFDLYFY